MEEQLFDSIEIDEPQPRGLDPELPSRNYYNRVNAIPLLTQSEQTELIERWQKFRDDKARERILRSHLRMPPAIARKAAVRFQPNKWVMTGPALVDAWKGHYGLVDELTAEGNLALVESVNHFDTTKGFSFSTYAGRSIWNAVNRRLRSFSSVVDRPWGKSVPLDIYIDAKLSDFLPTEDSCGGMARVAITSDDDKRKQGEPLPGKFARLRHSTDDLVYLRDAEHHLDQLPRLQAKTLRLRIAGFKLREVAEELGVSTPTTWRIEQSAYEQMRSLWNSSR